MTDPLTDPAADAWVESKLSMLTLDEKASLTSGADVWTTVAIERLAIPAMKVTDGPNGAHSNAVSGATAACFPVGAALGATWDRKLIEEVGQALAEETKSKGAQILLGPTVNIHRSPLGGRNFECYSEDPLLTAEIATAFIRALQRAGIGACIKHYVGNESEFERTTINSVIPERALREIYLRPFEHAVMTEEPWSLMGAYNRVDGEYACAQPRMLRQILKGEWGYSGLVISDWGAVHDTVLSGNGGCDLEMPGPANHLGPALAEAVRRGEVAETNVDDMARRVLRTLWRVGLADTPKSFEESTDDRIEHRELIRRTSAASMVLLKNDPIGEGAALLPISVSASATPLTVAVIGPNAERSSIMGGGSSFVKAHHQVHPLAALRARLGDAAVLHAPGGTITRYLKAPAPERLKPIGDTSRRFELAFYDTDDISAEPDDPNSARCFSQRTVSEISWSWWVPPVDQPESRRWGSRWKATFVPDTDSAWSFAVAAVGQSRVLVDGALVTDNWSDPQPGDVLWGRGSTEVRGVATLIAGQEYELAVEYQFPAGEEERAAIRFGAAPVDATDPIVDAVAAAAQADIAVVVAGTDGEWETEGIDRVAMRLPGDQDRLISAVAAANPNTVVVLNTGSPVEMPWLDEVPAVLQAWFGGQEFGDALVDVLLGDIDPGGRLPTTFPMRYFDNPTVHNYPGENGEVHYGEGIFVGYRSYQTFGPAPLFPFGHGLSYSTFSFGEPRVTAAADNATEFTISVAVTNTGGRRGSTVAQLYVSPRRSRLARPDRELKEFAKVCLDPGECETVEMSLDHRAFAYFDPAQSAWVAEAGHYDVLLGSSCADIKGVAAVELAETVVTPV